MGIVWSGVRRTWSKTAAVIGLGLQPMGRVSIIGLFLSDGLVLMLVLIIFRLLQAFNGWMNGSTGLRVATEWGLKGSVLGIYGAPATMAVTSGCGCGGQ